MKHVFMEIACLTVGVVFFSAAYAKTRGYNEFRTSLIESFHISQDISKLTSLSLIVFEWVIAIYLLFFRGLISDNLKDSFIQTNIIMSFALIMLMAFTVFSCWLLFKGKKVSCNCFGQSETNISFDDVIRNSIFILVGSLYFLQSEVFSGKFFPVLLSTSPIMTIDRVNHLSNTEISIATHAALFGIVLIGFQLCLKLKHIRLLFSIQSKE